MDGVEINSFMAKKMAELRPKYFQVKNFRTAFIKEFKDFMNCKILINSLFSRICSEKGLVPTIVFLYH